MDALQRHSVLELIDGDYEVMPGIKILHAPGESSGHSIVRVEASGQAFYALADLSITPLNLSIQIGHAAALTKSNCRNLINTWFAHTVRTCCNQRVCQTTTAAHRKVEPTFLRVSSATRPFS